MATHDFTGNRHIHDVVLAFIEKRKAEAVLADAREKWLDAMMAARDEGVSIADISRATGVTSPNVTNTIRAAKEKRERKASA